MSTAPSCASPATVTAGWVRVLLGSITEEVLRKSPRPVLVVGPRIEASALASGRQVVACVDGSPYSEQASLSRPEWSATFGVPRWLVHVAAPTGLVATGDVSEFGHLKRLAEHSGT